MDYKKKLKIRLLWNLSFAALGLILVLVGYLTKSENSFFIGYGICLMVIGVIRTVQYWAVTKNEKTIRQQELSETDERLRMISERAKSWAFSIYLMIAGAAVIILMVLDHQDLALPFAWSVCGLTALYWIFWHVIQKKY